MTEALDTALAIVRDLKLPVFPCVETPDEKGKVSKRPYIKGGFKSASRDFEQIRRWWAQHPNAMIGVPTGQETGIFVIDIDQSEEKMAKKHLQRWALVTLLPVKP